MIRIGSGAALLATLAGLAVAGCGGGGAVDGGADASALVDGGGDGGRPLDGAMDAAAGQGPTGASCRAAGDCAPSTVGSGGSPACVTTGKDASGRDVAWPGGYCTTVCAATHTSNQTGLNSDCPGGHATCDAPAGSLGECRALCVTSSDCATGYACFVVNSDGFRGCLPRGYSECDPRVRRSCAGHADAGVVDLGASGDGGRDGDGGNGGDGGGAMTSAGETCVDVGDGTVGACRPACDPLAGTGCGPTAACHATRTTGEGACDPACSGGSCASGLGDPCLRDLDCPTGLGCVPVAASGDGGSGGDGGSDGGGDDGFVVTGRCARYCTSGSAPMQCTSGGACSPFLDANGQPVGAAGLCTR